MPLRVPFDSALLVGNLLHRLYLVALAYHKLKKIAVTRVGPACDACGMIMEVGMSLLISVLLPMRWQLGEQRELGNPKEVLLILGDAHVHAHILQFEPDLDVGKVHIRLLARHLGFITGQLMKEGTRSLQLDQHFIGPQLRGLTRQLEIFLVPAVLKKAPFGCVGRSNVI